MILQLTCSHATYLLWCPMIMSIFRIHAMLSSRISLELIFPIFDLFIFSLPASLQSGGRLACQDTEARLKVLAMGTLASTVPHELSCSNHAQWKHFLSEVAAHRKMWKFCLIQKWLQTGFQTMDQDLHGRSDAHPG